jgi:hypothetical protein
MDEVRFWRGPQILERPGLDYPALVQQHNAIGKKISTPLKLVSDSWSLNSETNY